MARQGIDAFAVAAIMVENPRKSPLQLLQEKCGGMSIGPNAAMARGTELEPEACNSYEIRFGVRILPACCPAPHLGTRP